MGPPSRPQSLTHMGEEDVLPWWGELWAHMLNSAAIQSGWQNSDWHLITDTLRTVLRTPETLALSADSISIQEGHHSTPQVMGQGLSVTYHIGQVFQGQSGPVCAPERACSLRL